MIIWFILFATLLVSLISFIGVFSLALSDKILKRYLVVLVGFAAGGLIGGAFLHLLPESVEPEALDTETVFGVFIIGFIIFFAMEKLLWRHCHERTCPIHTFVYLNLAGDGVHNFIDGLIIAASFLADIYLGFVTTLAVALHEIPQELGDFGVLVYGGLEKKRALMLNFFTALTAVGGGILGYFIAPCLGGGILYLLPLAAGGFVYIATADLIPELHKELDEKKSAAAFAAFLGGIVLMWLVKLLHHGG